MTDPDGASVRMRRRAGPHVRHFYRRMRALPTFWGRHCSLPRMAGPVGQPAPKRNRLESHNGAFSRPGRISYSMTRRSPVRPPFA